MPRSVNFTFLAGRYDRHETIAANAEQDWARNPVGSLIQLRLFSELLAREAAVKLRTLNASVHNFTDVIEAIERAGIPAEAITLFHDLRRKGNDATHRAAGDADAALAHLRLAHQLAIWYWRTFHDPAFKPPTFTRPEDPAVTAAQLAARLAQLEAQAAQAQSQAEAAKLEAQAAKAAAEQAALEKQLAEENAAHEAAEKALWEELAIENEKLAKQAQSAPAPVDAQKAIAEFIEKANKAAQKIKRSEKDTRREIDAQLRQAGWEADSEKLTHAKGARPEEGYDRAIAEWPTNDGVADYVLFRGLTVIGVVEAKHDANDVMGALGQAKRYSKSYAVKHDEQLAGGPWGAYRVPFVFATNGRPYLAQLETRSGVWFQDVRDPKRHGMALHGWPSPDGLAQRLKTDLVQAHKELKKNPVAALGLRYYQNHAIEAVESALAAGQEKILLAMATGTGKTRTAIGMIYRLIQSGRFQRVLFLVDRSALGEQTANAFKDTRIAGEKTFAQIFDLKELKDIVPEKDTRLHIATVQGFMARILDGDDPPPVDQYDCIVVDECHRGYTLDREMTDAELEFRDQREYVSKYRKVIEYFDAVKIGLTATPALHTTQIFGLPIYQYTYTQAVLDKMLVPQETERKIVTEQSRDGIHYRVSDVVTYYNKTLNAVEQAQLEDELDFDVEEFNRGVVTPEFNRVVCEALAEEIDPTLEDKTVVFCVDDAHADLVTDLLKKAFSAKYPGVDDNTVAKITGKADRPLQLIRLFRNEKQPSVAVTVDLLTTGIDVPEVSNLVFLRRVKSRILYEQMKGRATRLCPRISKEFFRVYDAVSQTELMKDQTDMRPTVVSPVRPFRVLVEELTRAPSPAAAEQIRDEIVTKLKRKRKALEEKAQGEFEGHAGMGTRALIEHLEKSTPAEAGAWLVQHAEAVGVMDRVSGGNGDRVVVHAGTDKLVGVFQDFGGRKPEDYLEAFGAFVRDNLNKIPALMVVAQRPRDLTRKELQTLAATLDAAGFREIDLRTAYRNATNEDVAATIIGHIRARAVGDALVPYEQRVQAAVRRLQKAHKWTTAQQKWLERLGKQLAQATVVDRAALDEEPFKDAGGYEQINAVFDGKVDEVLAALKDAVWRDAG